MNTKRTLQAVYPAQPSRDGDGVRIQRIAPAGQFGLFDPFLMLDEIASDHAADYIGGFPEHPHRGFETVTLMLKGRMRHRDHLGNEGIIGPGDVQWMSAASGILHSEMPEQDEGQLHGFQLWINLPAREKMAPPQYREIQADDIPLWQPSPGVVARVIAGQIGGIQGPVQGVATQPLVVDLTLEGQAKVDIPVSSTATVVAYVFRGEATLPASPASSGTAVVSAQHLARTHPGETFSVSNSGSHTTQLLVLAAEPLNEPIAHYGPFVMNTRDQIEQALDDFRNGTFTETTTR
ncbi:pirin family protein [Litorivivens sp.]|uniref:pirin family protein n=1 Tax=Litorivivens sp. TaxID=2020868 RepID=UPI003562B88E